MSQLPCESIFDEGSLEIIQACIVRLEVLVSQGSALAAYRLSRVFDPWSVFAPEIKAALEASEDKSERYAQIAFDRFVELHKQGDGEAAHYLALYYQIGYPFAPRDYSKSIELNESALSLGYVFAANDLLSMYGDHQSAFYNPSRAREMYNLLHAHDSGL